MKSFYCTLIIFIFHFFSFAQDFSKLDSLLLSYKRLEIESLEKQISSIENLKLKQLFQYEIAFQKTGEIVDTNSLNLDIVDEREKRIGQYLLTILNSRIDDKKSATQISQLLKLLREAEIVSDTIYINLVIQSINEKLLNNSKNLSRYLNYINVAEDYAQDSVDVFYTNLHKIFYVELQNDENPSGMLPDEIKEIDSLFIQVRNNAISPYFIAYAQSMESVFESFVKQDQVRALQLNDSARINYGKRPHYYSRYGIQSVNFNSAILLFKLSKFEKAIKLFQHAINNEHNLIYKMEGYDWLHKCYDSIGDYGNAYSAFKRMGEVKDSLNLLKHASEIEAIESKYDFKEKEKELAALALNNQKLVNKQNVLVPILLGVIILASLVFFLYRKYRSKSEQLEGEQSETLKKLDEIKSIVVKNHIVLKDKRKVYVADLMFIKSEDHYLNLFLADGNNYFVRGKLKDIKEELPPNFIQCHRSYIVNRNFVKQQMATILLLLNGERVPVSRSFKDNF